MTTPGRSCATQDSIQLLPALDLSALKAENKQAKREVQQLQTKVQRLEVEKAELEAEVAKLQMQKDKIARDYAELRRTSHNTIQLRTVGSLSYIVIYLITFRASRKCPRPRASQAD
jgi:cell division septum initiation protein DivIVA